MNFGKKIVLTSILCLFFGLTSLVYGQSKENSNQTNAEYVVELMKESLTKSVYIVAANMHKEYSKDWLTYISTEGEWIVFSKGDKTHRWNIKNSVFIEKYGDVIKVRMNESIGE